jgi:hypothetical protein
MISVLHISASWSASPLGGGMRRCVRVWNGKTLPQHDQLTTTPAFAVSSANPDSAIRGTLQVNVDDGRYDVLVTVATYDDKAMATSPLPRTSHG